MDKFITKECKNHGITEFVKEGGGYYRCKKCRSGRVSEQRRKNKKILVEEHGGKCKICGYNRYYGSLQFHHIDPTTKSFGVSDGGISNGISRMREESKKCILLCANCHAELENGIIELKIKGV